MREFKEIIEQFEINKKKYYMEENQHERDIISTTQMASTPLLEGEDAKRLLDSLRDRPTERSRENAKRLKEHFASNEAKPVYRLEQSFIEMNNIRSGKEKGKSWEHLKQELNAISANAKLLEGKDGMIELDPTNKSNVEWFEDASHEGE